MVANKIYKAGFANIIDLDKGMRVWYKNDFEYSYTLHQDNEYN